VAVVQGQGFGAEMSRLNALGHRRTGLRGEVYVGITGKRGWCRADQSFRSHRKVAQRPVAVTRAAIEDSISGYAASLVCKKRFHGWNDRAVLLSIIVSPSRELECCVVRGARGSSRRRSRLFRVAQAMDSALTLSRPKLKGLSCLSTMSSVAHFKR